jgi:class 3 adenylate cyclase
MSCRRIGINVGDIFVEDADIFGDGVNVAVRLEGLPEPGAVNRPIGPSRFVVDSLLEGGGFELLRDSRTRLLPESRIYGIP